MAVLCFFHNEREPVSRLFGEDARYTQLHVWHPESRWRSDAHTAYLRSHGFSRMWSAARPLWRGPRTWKRKFLVAGVARCRSQGAAHCSGRRKLTTGIPAYDITQRISRRRRPCLAEHGTAQRINIAAGGLCHVPEHLHSRPFNADGVQRSIVQTRHERWRSRRAGFAKYLSRL